MANRPDIPTISIGTVLDHAPSSIRETMMKYTGSIEEHRLPTDSILTFDELTIQLSALSDASRSVLTGKSSAEVIDGSRKKWKIRNTSPEGELPRLVICGGAERTLPPIFMTLSPDPHTRVSCFNLATQQVNLPETAIRKWRGILVHRALNTEELLAIDSDICLTPSAILKTINIEISRGQSPISSLIPPSREYFERLVGKYDGSSSVRKYAAAAGRLQFNQLSMWRPYEGFLLSLLLSSHASLTDEIEVERLSSDQLLKALEYLVTSGDCISHLGAIEVGLRVLPSRPELEEPLIRLIELIRDDDAGKPTSAFKLLSSLFCFVDGELASTRLLSDTPPFYRRLAAMTQAALIHRQLVPSSVDTDEFQNWIPENRKFQHYLQSFADMRQEPRWDPRFAAPSQIKSEFIGRIMFRAGRHLHDTKNSPIYKLFFHNESDRLRSSSNLFGSFIPGPLEGGETPRDSLPIEFTETIRNQLSAEQTGPESFVAFVNIGLTFGLNEELSTLAEFALRKAGYQLENLENREQLVATLHGLATVAAAARSTVLADALRIVVRNYRADSEMALSIQESANILLASAASRSELKAWTDYVGGCITELAFGELSRDEGLECYAYLSGLRHAVPELRETCGRADDILSAFNTN